MKKQKEKKQKFKILHDEIVFNGKFIKTIRRHFLDRAGHKIFWEMVERKLGGRNGKKKRIVAIAAITPKREIVLEKCFRVPLKDYTIELPAGLMDKPGESEKSAIRRELLEETGYAVSKVELLTAGPFNSGLTSDKLAIYLGTNARKIAEPKLECSEDIETILVPISKLLSFIKKNRRRGVEVDLKLPSILPFLSESGLSV
ncbi:hypothetical protein A3G55_00270 [Candidatus Giovannonibacteria bacterium RIFCSPLOWO2_12_FULL_44_25]|uniref:Nudix hydrolase domain-containing protein n=2 Tax=Candidatus Giovannoniibacteriota TaxID=1752738 RepID=A0A1F5W7X6_9BACT|nr:MAG: hypothetical protein UW15_C0021G0008 [Parcubacteria group bacterium GW2011_GWC1_44_10]KKT59298.1 MAG: hypothetical protein UW53_C0016G0008 [Candidatus Giovannonibacteria bacterium GW2011_GWA1_44_25]KKU29055.1 MAG: hypothetical protein UX43_C0016G0010 [Candidatus Giovannonibacteria bacterium GW2011_GWB1_46_20]OGF49270.1 MAG: hypothetical protein A2120_03055 [Candidatus Giovannonibacteria bacterium GWA2_45_15]OGF60168.1 MAG: hypothetical protein A2656_04325 [Candidatus Giovannonibacteria 